MMFTADFFYGTVVLCIVGAYLYLFVNQRFDMASNPKRGVIYGDVPPEGDPSLVGPQGKPGVDGMIEVMSDTDRAAWEETLKKHVEKRNFWMGTFVNYLLPALLLGVGLYAFYVDPEPMMVVITLLGIGLLVYAESESKPEPEPEPESMQRPDAKTDRLMIAPASYSSYYTLLSIFLVVSVAALAWTVRYLRAQSFEGRFEALTSEYERLKEQGLLN